MAGRQLTRWLVTASIAAMTVACTEDPARPSHANIDCETSGGTSHSGNLTGEHIWTRQRSPHRLVGTVRVQNLRVAAGAVICGEPRSVLEPQQIEVAGKPDSQAIFTAAKPDSGWGGLRLFVLPRSSQIRHALVEYADQGIVSDQPLLIEDSRFRVIQGVGLAVRTATIRRVVIDSVCLQGTLGCAGICLPNLNNEMIAAAVVVEESIVRASGAVGIDVSYYAASLTLRDVRIEGSASIGLLVGSYYHRNPQLIVEQPVHITGGANRAASIDVNDLSQLVPDDAAASRLLGNAVDTIFVRNWSGTGDTLTIRRGLPVLLGSTWPCSGANVKMQPGAYLRVTGCYTIGVSVNGLRGSPAAPITIQGAGEPLDVMATADTLRIMHARLRNVKLTTRGPAVIEHVQFDSGGVVLPGTGSRLADVTINGPLPLESFFYNPDQAAVILGPGARMERTSIRDASHNGVIINGPGVFLSDCTIRRSASNGIVVKHAGARITGCNLENNRGDGVRNQSADSVDARGSWWGDPAGPLGPSGDGVTAGVNYVPFLTTPIAAPSVLSRPILQSPQRVHSVGLPDLRRR